MSRRNGKRVPSVRIAQPAGRPLQLRWTDPDTRKEVRISTNTYDLDEAREQQQDLQAQLRLGLKPQPQKRRRPGDAIGWDEFRDQYTDLHIKTLRSKTQPWTEKVLDQIERIAEPTFLGDLADAHRLREIESKLRSGAQSRFNAPRSTASVRTMMNVLIAALNWAEEHGLIEKAPRFTKIKLPKKKRMKGRPITLEEFERMLAAAPKVVGDAGSDSWCYLMRGIWEQAFRLDEALHVAWDIPGCIVPEWPRGKYPVLVIPCDQQKNDTDEEIPVMPRFEQLLFETPEDDRTGYVFNPAPINGEGWQRGRPNVDWVGKVITRIGELAGVIVVPAKVTPGSAPPKPEPVTVRLKRDGTPRKVQPKPKRLKRSANYKPPKFASAHDLRRSCLERLRDEGYPLSVIKMVARHASFQTTEKYYAPGKVQAAAAMLHKRPGYNVMGTFPVEVDDDT
jgi:integrase